jgi:ferrochelatase
MSSFESAVARVKEVAAKLTPQVRIQVQPPFFHQPDYIAALVARAQEFLKSGYDHLLFSFHGLPERHLRKADPTRAHCLMTENCCQVASPALATCYRAQCFQTVAAFVKEAGVPKEKYSVAFQSRLGRDPWLKPYSDLELPRLASAGVKKLLVMCPAFVSDCLETLEEMGLRGKESFIAAGGAQFGLIPCLNEHPLWVQVLEKMVGRFTTPSLCH